MSITDERDFYVATRRAYGDKLSTIGKDLGGITSERVRQLEFKTVKAFEELENLIKRFFKLLKIYSTEKNSITVEEAEKLVDAESLKLILYFTEKTNFGLKIFYFDENLNAVVFYDEKNFTETLPKVISEEDYIAMVKKLVREKNFI